MGNGQSTIVDSSTWWFYTWKFIYRSRLTHRLPTTMRAIQYNNDLLTSLNSTRAHTDNTIIHCCAHQPERKWRPCPRVFNSCRWQEYFTHTCFIHLQTNIHTLYNIYIYTFNGHPIGCLESSLYPMQIRLNDKRLHEGYKGTWKPSAHKNKLSIDKIYFTSLSVLKNIK